MREADPVRTRTGEQEPAACPVIYMRVGSAFVCATTMANSRFQYVKKFELPDALMQDTYLITRLDGHRFTKFTAEHGFSKPNDERGLLLMTEVSNTASIFEYRFLTGAVSMCLEIYLHYCTVIVAASSAGTVVVSA